MCFVILDEIAATARASTDARISARLVGRVLGLRLGLRTWEAQRVAKAWARSRHGRGARALAGRVKSRIQGRFAETRP